MSDANSAFVAIGDPTECVRPLRRALRWSDLIVPGNLRSARSAGWLRV
jgi:hypothetical protein